MKANEQSISGVQYLDIIIELILSKFYPTLKGKIYILEIHVETSNFLAELPNFLWRHAPLPLQ